MNKYRDLKTTNDPTYHLMVYMSGSQGGGRSATSSPCGLGAFRYSKNACGKLGYGGVVNCAGVSIMAIQVVEFSNGVYKIRKIFA